MIIGPVFAREASITPRRGRHYLYRAVYVTALMILMCTAWLVLAGTQIIRNVGDMARFGSILFQILAPLQLALCTFIAALASASSVSQEKDRRTLILLLMTRMTNSELVLGKLLASLLNVFAMLLAAVPVFMLTALFGGVALPQISRVFAVTVGTVLVAGSLGSTLALWREKTFQTLSMTALALLMWVGLGEAVDAGLLGTLPAGIPATELAASMSPLHAIFVAAQAELAGSQQAAWGGGVAAFLVTSLVLAAVLNAVAILRVRVWNPSRELRPGQQEQARQESIWGAEYDLAQERRLKSREPRGESGAETGGVDTGGVEPGSRALVAREAEPERAERAEQARAGHVDARTQRAAGKSRRVWDNPILWREMCTWAYGRKVLVIRLAYLVLFAGVLLGLQAWLDAGIMAAGDDLGAAIPAAAKPLAPFFLVSLVIVNALAVTSITNERDGQSLDLLLVTDLSPKEFVFGKLGGVLWITKEMVLLPMALCVYLWWRGGLGGENLVFVLGGLATMNVFVAMLGIHYGMIYASSRSAIGVSLGTVFFLFLGVVTCMLIMISFSGSFQTQLAPFLAFILGGGVGLFVALGARNPSPAIGVASLLLPFATFYAITSFLLDYPLAVFLVTTATYGFTTAAMMVPAVGEFDIAMGRTKAAGDE